MRLNFRALLAAGMLAIATAGPAFAGAAAALQPQRTASGLVEPAAAASNYRWQRGPLDVRLMDQASLALPAGFAFLEKDGAQRLLQSMGNPNVGDVVGVVTGSDGDWLAVLRFDAAGFIPDADAGKWNMDAMLAAIRSGTEQTNRERRAQQVQEIEILGWLEQPHYDPRQHRLSWGIAVRNQGDAAAQSQALNYNTYLLGRDGYFSLNLVTGLQELDRNRPHADALVAGVQFVDGKRYGDFNAATDKVAPFGLTALVGGNAAAPKQENAKSTAAVSKESFFARYGKLLLAIAIALIAAVIGVVAWLLLRKEKTASPEPPELSEEAATQDGAA